MPTSKCFTAALSFAQLILLSVMVTKARQSLQKCSVLAPRTAGLVEKIYMIP